MTPRRNATELEHCCDCGAPTDRAGRADDSLYTDDDHGPLCIDCYQKREEAQ